MPNNEIAQYGKNTRFGSEKGADPSAAATKRNTEQNPTSVRASLRRLMALEVDITATMTPAQIARAFGREGVKLTMAQSLAVKKVQQAMGNWKAMDSLIDAVDGKQVQAVVEAKATLADLVNASVSIERQQEQQAQMEPDETEQS